MSKIGGFILSVVCLVSENCFRRIYNKTVHAARVFPANRGFPRFVGKVFEVQEFQVVRFGVGSSIYPFRTYFSFEHFVIKISFKCATEFEEETLHT